MNNIKISFIIPVYNGERTIKKCLNSITSQACKDYEIIIIDDGSTDNSYKICTNYSSEYENITVLHKDNGGVSSARNLGIEKAKGIWVTFVDADDEINKNSLEKVKPLLDIGTDIIIMNSVKNKKYRPYSFENIPTDKILDFNPIYSKYKYTRGSVWGCLYRLTSIRKYKLEFSTEIKNGEDSLFFSLVQYYFEKVYFTNIDFYRVNTMPDSASSLWDDKKILKLADNLSSIEYFFKKSKIDYSQIPIFNVLVYKYILYVYIIYFQNSNSIEILKVIRKNIRQSSLYPIHTKDFPIMRRFQVYLLNSSVMLFELSMKIQFKR